MRSIGRALLFLTTSLTASCSADLAKTINEMGHQELRPPTTLTPPGTIVVIRSEEPLEVAVVCTQDEVIKRADILTSRTQSVTLAEKTKTSFKLGATYLAAYGIDLKGSHIERVSVTLNNAEVLEISDAAIQSGALALDPSCRKAIEVRREHHRTLGMIKSALKANVVYTVDIDNTVDAAGRAALLSGLALKLGGSVDSSRQSTIKGEGLYWGIRTDTDFFTPSAAGMSVYGLPVPPEPPTAREILDRVLLLSSGPPISRVLPKNADALDYSP